MTTVSVAADAVAVTAAVGLIEKAREKQMLLLMQASSCAEDPTLARREVSSLPASLSYRTLLSLAPLRVGLEFSDTARA